MVSKHKKPMEIVKVRAERNTLLVRLPKWFIFENSIDRNSYIVFNHGGKGEARLKTLQDT